MQRYEKLFKQLYQQRLIDKQTPTTSLDRVRIIQKKMNQNQSKRQSKLNISLKLSDKSPFLQDFNTQECPKRILRQTFNNHKLLTNRKLSLQCKSQNYPLNTQTNDADKTLKIILQKNKSLTQRQKIPINYPTALYHTKNYQIIKRQATPGSQSFHRNKSLVVKRSRTPSRNVVIAGCNLQQEAESHRKQFHELQIQIQKYNAQLKQRQTIASRNLAQRIKTNRYERQINVNLRKQNSIIKQTKQIMRKLQISRIRQKQQATDLMPWTVLVPQYQYY